jgi:hypothetical protein
MFLLFGLNASLEGMELPISAVNGVMRSRETTYAFRTA